MNDFFKKFDGLKGASFIGIKEYLNAHGEIANINLLTNVSTMNAKKNDLERLKAVTESELNALAKDGSISIDVFKVALSELIASGEKNCSEESSDHTVSSQAQADAYVHISKGVKLHKDTMNLFIDGFLHKKVVLVKGEYPVKNQRDKTIAKEKIGKYCKLRMLDYRQYNLGNAEQILVNGSTLQVVRV